MCRVFVHENLGRGVSRRVGIWQETREDEVVPDRYLHLHQGVIVHRLTLFLSSNPLAILLTPQLGLLSHPADFILATLWPPSWPLIFFKDQSRFSRHLSDLPVFVCTVYNSVYCFP